jgi:hypothetical protein
MLTFMDAGVVCGGNPEGTVMRACSQDQAKRGVGRMMIAPAPSLRTMSFLSGLAWSVMADYTDERRVIVFGEPPCARIKMNKYHSAN